MKTQHPTSKTTKALKKPQPDRNPHYYPTINLTSIAKTKRRKRNPQQRKKNPSPLPLQNAKAPTYKLSKNVSQLNKPPRKPAKKPRRKNVPV